MPSARCRLCGAVTGVLAAQIGCSPLWTEASAQENEEISGWEFLSRYLKGCMRPSVVIVSASWGVFGWGWGGERNSTSLFNSL